MLVISLSFLLRQGSYSLTSQTVLRQIHQKLGYDLAGNSATTTKPNPGITLASSCDEGTWDKAWLGLP